MSQYDRDMHKFVLGEIRVDGWVSDWRRTQEKRRIEEMGQRRFVSAPQIRARQSRPRGPHNSLPRKCEVCGSRIRQDNKSGRCGSHRIFLQPPVRSQCPYTGCIGSITHRNVYGICKKHFSKFRRMLRQTEIRVCAEDGCFIALYHNCKLTHCRKHSKAERSALEVIRMRKVRAKARELGLAACRVGRTFPSSQRTRNKGFGRGNSTGSRGFLLCQRIH